MGNSNYSVIEKVAKKANECFKKVDGNLFKACVGAVWHSGAPACRRGPTDIGVHFINECMLLIAEFNIGHNQHNQDASNLLKQAGLSECSFRTPPYPKVYLSEVRALFEDKIQCCHNGYCDSPRSLPHGSILGGIQYIFDELSTISDKEWDEAIDWLYR